MPDFMFANHGSVCILIPVSGDAEAWIAENIGSDAMSWGKGVVIEPRYVDPILEGIEEAGMVVS
jgi:hypothetical protein